MNSLNVLRKKLTDEGYKEIYEWSDDPYYEYQVHIHATDTTLFVLEGEITVTIEGKSRTYHKGERVIVPAHKKHSAQVGKEGASYLVGENRS